MITEESLREKYIDLTDADLLNIVARKDDYTDLAVAVARQELKKRKVPEADIIEHKLIVATEAHQSENKNGIVDLELWRKIALYIIWVPRLRIYFIEDYPAGGFILKSNQATYYSVLGGVFFAIGCGSKYFIDSFV